MTNNKWNYFKPEEVVGLDSELVAKLDVARHRSGVPYTITDGLRTAAGNTDRNAVNNSAHLVGKAVDLRCRDSRTLWKMLDGLVAAGFKRIGIYFVITDGNIRPTHIHVDTDETKDQEVVWLTLEK